MAARHSTGNSSLFLSLPFMISMAIASIMLAYSDYVELAIILFAILSVAIIARLYGYLSTKSVRASIESHVKAMFPDERAVVVIKVENNKILPLPWINLFMPLSQNGCVKTPYDRKTESFEKARLSSIGAETSYVADMRCKSLLWYGKAEYKVEVIATKRGVLDLSSWVLKTGDFFALSEEEIPLLNGGRIVIYPRIVGVNTAPLRKNLNSSSSGLKGSLDDISLIKSTRSYQVTDNPKHINWRLLSRGLPLSVNQYQKIKPRSIHIIFDGESFSLPKKHSLEMENTLSIIASLLLALKKDDINVYLSLPQGRNNKAITLTPTESVEEMMLKLSLYDVMEAKLSEDGIHIVEQEAVFSEDRILQSLQDVGHVFYFCYSAERIKGCKLLSLIEGRYTTKVLYNKTSDDEGLSIDALRRIDG